VRAHEPARRPSGRSPGKATRRGTPPGSGAPFAAPDALLPETLIGLQGAVGNGAVSRLVQSQRRPPEGRAEHANPLTLVQRHSDRALEQQLEAAKRAEEEGPVVQRHLLPKPEQGGFPANVTADMANTLIAQVAAEKESSRQSIINWLKQNVGPGKLLNDKLEEVNRLDWEINLQKLTFPARVDPSNAGKITIYPLYPDHYAANGSVNLSKLKTTMTHEAFHSISAKHTGLQMEGVTQKGSYDEAFTDLFAMQAFHLENSDLEAYISGYWSGTGDRRWTGDLAQIVEEVTGLTRADMISAYLSDPSAALGKIKANEALIKEVWEKVAPDNPVGKPDAGQSVIEASGPKREAGDKALRKLVQDTRGTAGPADGPPLVRPAAGADEPMEKYEKSGPESTDVAAAGADPAKAAELEELLKQIAAFSQLPQKSMAEKKARNQRKAELLPKAREFNPNIGLLTPDEVKDLEKALEKIKPKADGKVRYDHLHQAAKALGFRREGEADFGLRVVIPPANALGKTRVADLPAECLTPTLRGAGLATMAEVFPGLGAEQSAADFLLGMGGGGYEAMTFTVGIHPSNDRDYGYYVHELGHVKQHQQGFTEYGVSDKGSAIRQLVLDYHNVVVNENPNTYLKNASAPDRVIRVRYAVAPNKQKESEILRDGGAVDYSAKDAANELKANAAEERLLEQIMAVTAQADYRITGDGGKNVLGPYILKNLVAEQKAKSAAPTH
jgi:hypothetical protein